ncbi:MAG: ImmA/IrrE family metallo-endopeptidase [Chloroflexota bacterium]
MRLREAREARRMTQQQVAEHLGLKNHQPIARMEQGQRDVSTIELVELARLYHRSLAYFVRTDEPDLTATDDAAPFRAAGLVDSDFIQLDRIAHRCRESAALRRSLGIAPGAASTTRFTCEPMHRLDQAIAQAECIAADARRILGLGSDEPILDLADLLEDQGIAVFEATLRPNVSGLCVSEPLTGRLIVINQNERPVSNATTIAHELCHLLVDEDAHVCIDEDKRDLDEVRASRFAEALPLPRSALEAFRPAGFGIEWHELNPVHVVGIQLHFHVRYEVVLDRLRHLGFIGEEHCHRLSRVPREHLTHLMGSELDREISRPLTFERRLRAIALEAFRAGKISRGRLAEILDVDFDELAILLSSLRIEAPPIKLKPGRRNPLISDSA